MAGKQNTTLEIEPLVYNVSEVAQLLGLSKTATWEAVWRGEVPSIRVGRRVLVPRQALQGFLDRVGGDERNGAES